MKKILDKKDQAMTERLDWLCGIQLGTVWTEYHWREALQLKKEVRDELDWWKQGCG